MQAIIYYKIGYNAIDITNQILFAWHGIAIELKVSVTVLIELIRVANVICMLEKKEEV